MKWLCAALVAFSSAAVTAQSVPSSIPVHVSEVGGIRRTQFPVTARIPFPRGVLRDPANIKLLSNQTEVPGQAAAEARWPDGSVQFLSLDFNVTIGPNESQTYSLQYGEGVKSEAAARGLTVAEEADAIQVGNIRFNKSGSPLIASVKYRDEAIGIGCERPQREGSVRRGSRFVDGGKRQSRDRQARTAGGGAEVLRCNSTRQGGEGAVLADG